jgi:hypothetical protein
MKPKEKNLSVSKMSSCRMAGKKEYSSLCTYGLFVLYKVEITTAGDPLTIENYYNVKCTGPISLQAKFETDDPDLKQNNGYGLAYNKPLCAGYVDE